MSRLRSNNPPIHPTTTTSLHHQVHPSSNPPSIRMLYPMASACAEPSTRSSLVWKGVRTGGRMFHQAEEVGALFFPSSDHDPFISSSTHHSSSTSQHGATSSKSPKDVRDPPTSLAGMMPPSSWPQLDRCCCWNPKLRDTISFRTEILPH